VITDGESSIAGLIQVGSSFARERNHSVIVERWPRHRSWKHRDQQRWARAKALKEETVTKQLRGFATMDVTKQREIARMGGKAAHAKGTAHEWSREQARLAGHKGGLARARRMEPIIAARKKNQP
jgi:general stress protein YciG